MARFGDVNGLGTLRATPDAPDRAASPPSEPADGGVWGRRLRRLDALSERLAAQAETAGPSVCELAGGVCELLEWLELHPSQREGVIGLLASGVLRVAPSWHSDVVGLAGEGEPGIRNLLLGKRALERLLGDGLAARCGEFAEGQRTPTGTRWQVGPSARAAAYAFRLLSRWAEPVAVLAWRRGVCGQSADALIERAWAHALRAWGPDGRDGRAGFAEVLGGEAVAIAEAVIDRSLQALSGGTRSERSRVGEAALVVWNALPHERGGVVRFAVEAAEDGSDPEPVLTDEYDRGLPVQWDERTSGPKRCGYVELRDIPALGHAGFRFSLREAAKGAPAAHRTSQLTGLLRAENGSIILQLRVDGSFDLTHKESGKVYPRLGFVEAAPRESDPRTTSARRCPRTTSLGARAVIGVEEDGPLVTVFRIETEVVPLAFGGVDPDGEVARRPIPVGLRLGVVKGRPWVSVDVETGQAPSDVGLQLVWTTTLHPATLSVDTGEGVQEIPHDPGAPRPPTLLDFGRWVDLSDGICGLALLADRFPSFAFVEDDTPTVVLPLPDLSENGDCRSRLALYPHMGDWQRGEVGYHAETFLTPLRAVASPRFDPSFPPRLSYLHVTPSSVEVRAVKRTDGRESITLRAANPTRSEVLGRVRVYWPLAAAYQLTTDEARTGELQVEGRHAVSLRLQPGEIRTIELVPS